VLRGGVSSLCRPLLELKLSYSNVQLARGALRVDQIIQLLLLCKKELQCVCGCYACRFSANQVFGTHINAKIVVVSVVCTVQSTTSF
jgi:hypothetical protein